MRPQLLRSRKGLSTIVAEVLMLLIVIILSSMVFIWAVPTFQFNTGQDNSGAAYAEKFSTLWGNFATFAPSTAEAVDKCTGIPASGLCPPSSPVTCTGSITVATTSNIIVPVNGVCVITANVGSVFASTGSNLTVVGATINGGLVGNYSASVTLKNVSVSGFTALLNDKADNIIGSSFDTSGNTSWCSDGCDMAIYDGGRGTFSLVNSTINGQIESEVSHQAVVTGNTVTGRLEIESADFGQIMNNKAGMLDLDQNGIVVISGNTIYGNDSYYPGSNVCASGTATAVCYGCGNGYACGGVYGGLVYGNRWCAQGNNVVISGSHNDPACIGNLEIDITNTGSTTVNLIAAYMSGIPLAGPVTWKLFSGGASHSSLPITIPVGQSANVTMQWTPPPSSFALPWMDIYFIFVSSHNNFVDGHLYFGYNPALTIPSQSRPENRICPPCY